MSSTSQRIPTTIAFRSLSRNYSLAKIVTRQRTKWIRNEEPGPVLVSSGMHLDLPFWDASRGDLLPQRAEITRAQGREGGYRGVRRGCFDGCGSRMRSAGLAFSRREANLGREKNGPRLPRVSLGEWHDEDAALSS